MKRKIIYVMLSLAISFSFLMLTACSFDVNLNWNNLKNGCAGSTQEETYPQPEVPPDAGVDEYKLEIVEKDGFYYPTISGAIFATKYPNKIVLSFNGCEKELKPTKLKNKTNGYIFWFDEVVLYSQIKQGDYKYSVKAYYGNKVVNTEVVNDITIDDEYFGATIIDARTGKLINAMDAESSWTPFF